MNDSTETLKARLAAWYDAHIVAKWYSSLALWVGIFASLFPYALDILDAALAQWPQVAEVLRLTPFQTMVIQIMLATVVLPAARAWRQKSMQEAALVQAVKSGTVGSFIGSEAVVVAVEGREPIAVHPLQAE